MPSKMLSACKGGKNPGSSSSHENQSLVQMMEGSINESGYTVFDKHHMPICSNKDSEPEGLICEKMAYYPNTLQVNLGSLEKALASPIDAEGPN